MGPRYILAVAALALMVAAVILAFSLPRPAGEYFIVDVHGERFVIHVLDEESIRLAEENMRGENKFFPLGELARGDGGFNRPWSWHLKPDTVRMVEVSIELCDGLPSHIEENLDYWIENVGSYCPWGARIVGKP